MTKTNMNKNITWSGESYRVKVYADGELIATSNPRRKAIALIEKISPKGKRKYYFKYAEETI